MQNTGPREVKRKRESGTRLIPDHGIPEKRRALFNTFSLRGGGGVSARLVVLIVTIILDLIGTDVK